MIAFLSANHVEPDIAVETFILAPLEQRSGGPLTAPAGPGLLDAATAPAAAAPGRRPTCLAGRSVGEGQHVADPAELEDALHGGRPAQQRQAMGVGA